MLERITNLVRDSGLRNRWNGKQTGTQNEGSWPNDKNEYSRFFANFRKA